MALPAVEHRSCAKNEGTDAEGGPCGGCARTVGGRRERTVREGGHRVMWGAKRKCGSSRRQNRKRVRVEHTFGWIDNFRWLRVQKPHDLQAVYVRFVDALFEHNMAYPLLCMTSLGHDTMIDTLHYMSVVFNGEIPKKEYGKLRMVE